MADRKLEYGDCKMFIDGEFVDSVSGKTVDVESPTTEEVIGTIPDGNGEDAQRALESAKAAQPAWAATPAVERGNILSKFADLILENQERLARLCTIEMGKSFT